MAVCSIDQDNIRGVVYIEPVYGKYVVLGSIIGLKAGKYNLTIHQYGDISRGCESIGDVERIIGTIFVNRYGVAYIYIDVDIHISAIIGKALSISKNDKALACGVIGVSFINEKLAYFSHN
ncbi:inactive cu-Zn superoxide dismutase-like virion protein [Raccoonpox virus]|uniref:Cu-Zn superoxide dismutase-like protein n=1 Tax=Raccoon poxvirus TaxID=10256 RepID=A0A0G3G4K8_RACVI|nr:Cu-Zn superoxide dismutase-like protein [Raccoonpox virus]AKJ93796.1 Cu-Zn superoxide dismutase-like protein [Raccoonpox virus]AOP31428.1 inactive cu-Zn superoxide dismutase-like virion protein [Raccoonpox virus]